MENDETKDVSDPLKHLMSLDFGRTSPLLDNQDFSSIDNMVSKPGRRVRFSDVEVPPARPGSGTIEELKSILKNKLTFNENYVSFNEMGSSTLDDQSSDISDDALDYIIDIEDEHAADNLNEGSSDVSDEVYCTLTFMNADSSNLDDENLQNSDDTFSGTMSEQPSQIGENAIMKNQIDIAPVKTESRENSSHCPISCGAAESIKKEVIISPTRFQPGVPEKKKKWSSQKFMTTDVACLSPQSKKLRKFLNEDSTEVLSANELRSNVFNAWCKIKSEAKPKTTAPCQDKPERSKNVASEKEKSSDAFAKWKLMKEMSIRKRKMMEKDVAVNLKEKSHQTDAFNLWKKRKDEELREYKIKQKKKEMEEKTNAIRAKELQKQEATSAFLAWSDQKKVIEDEKGQLSLSKTNKAFRYKTEELAERIKESQLAYFLWLERKDEYKSTSSSFPRPPWNPPG